MRKVKVDEALGLAIAHDMTEVNVAKKIKQVAFKKRHVIQAGDIEKLKSLGRENIFVFDEVEDEVHEDEAALLLAPLLAGANIYHDQEPREGKISFYAAIDGLFKLDAEKIIAINRLGIPSLPTIHNNFVVKKGRQVAAFRIIPLTCKAEIIQACRDILSRENPGGDSFKGSALSVMPLTKRTAALIVTGNEVYSGRIEDKFTAVIEKKLKAFGVELSARTIMPDDRESIKEQISLFAESADLLILTGGTSVDPDDATKAAMADAGVALLQAGNPLQPGNNFTLGYLGNKPVCAVPAAALFFKITAFDIFLPRLLAADQITSDELAAMSIGGLCHFCEVCRYPICPFGRSI
ncbi:MAG: molybdopterin-binding protein [Deltaproteobacteria bacterium]|nr:molybdopterin-binding protein [Deltaproteobacteria bacterium]